MDGGYISTIAAQQLDPKSMVCLKIAKTHSTCSPSIYRYIICIDIFIYIYICTNTHTHTLYVHDLHLHIYLNP